MLKVGVSTLDHLSLEVNHVPLLIALKVQNLSQSMNLTVIQVGKYRCPCGYLTVCVTVSLSIDKMTLDFFSVTHKNKLDP